MYYAHEINTIYENTFIKCLCKCQNRLNPLVRNNHEIQLFHIQSKMFCFPQIFFLQLRTEPYYWDEDRTLPLSWGQSPTIELHWSAGGARGHSGVKLVVGQVSTGQRHLLPLLTLSMGTLKHPRFLGAFWKLTSLWSIGLKCLLLYF